MPSIDLSGLPENVQQVLTVFLDAAQQAFGNSLRSAILFGSAAEGRLRATSDVNMILVLTAFEKSQVDSVREPLRLAEAAIKLRVMFLLESEIAAAATAFAQKFADIKRRRKVLLGEDPFAGLQIPREAEISRLKQVLLNLTMRLRESYASRSQRQEQIALVLAETAGPLRAAAATLLELEGRTVTDAKRSLEQVANEEGPDRGGFADVLQQLSRAREFTSPDAQTDAILMGLLELARRVYRRAERLK